MLITFESASIALGKNKLQIIKPIVDLSKIYVVRVQEKSYIVFGDEMGLSMLSTIIEVLSNNPDYIIYLDTRQSVLTDYIRERWTTNSKPYDLVLLHHSTQLKIHEWKQIKGKWKKTNKQTMELFTRPIEVTNRNLQEYYYREHKDFLDINERFETLFLTGSSKVFKDISKDTLSVSENGREQFLRFPGTHDHEHLDYYARREYTKNYKYDGSFLCVDFYDGELWER